MSVDQELGYASEFLRGAREALGRAYEQRPDMAGIGLIQHEVQITEGQLHHLINRKREKEK